MISIGLMDEVLAPDDRTLVIRWKRPYFEAGNLEAAGGTSSPSFPALPRHDLDRTDGRGAGPGRPYPGDSVEAAVLRGRQPGSGRRHQQPFIPCSAPP